MDKEDVEDAVACNAEQPVVYGAYDAKQQDAANGNRKTQALGECRAEAPDLAWFFADVHCLDYQKVVVTDASLGIEKAKENYLNKIPSTVTGKEENKVITIEKIINVVIDGNTYYYITDTEGSKYKVSIKVEKDVLPYLTEGSVLNVYYNSKTDVTNIIKLEKALD